MRFPLVTRSHHDEVVELLRAQLDRVELERRFYLDRLAEAGLGGAFYQRKETLTDASPEASADEELTEEQRLAALRRHPARLAAAVTRKFRRDSHRLGDDMARGAHIQQVTDDLDRAEADGRGRTA